MDKLLQEKFKQFKKKKTKELKRQILIHLDN